MDSWTHGYLQRTRPCPHKILNFCFGTKAGFPPVTKRIGLSLCLVQCLYVRMLTVPCTRHESICTHASVINDSMSSSTSSLGLSAPTRLCFTGCNVEIHCILKSGGRGPFDAFRVFSSAVLKMVLVCQSTAFSRCHTACRTPVAKESQTKQTLRPNFLSQTMTSRDCRQHIEPRSLAKPRAKIEHLSRASSSKIRE